MLLSAFGSGLHEIKMWAREVNMVYGLILIISIVALSFLLKKREKKQMKRYGLESPIELRLFKAFKRKRIDVIPQYKVKGYRIDLAYFPEGEDAEVKIAIECNGKMHHTLAKDKECDKEKNKFLRKEGWRVVRFTGRQIYKDPYKLVNKVIGIAQGQKRVKKFSKRQKNHHDTL